MSPRDKILKTHTGGPTTPAPIPVSGETPPVADTGDADTVSDDENGEDAEEEAEEANHKNSSDTPKPKRKKKKAKR